MFDEPVVLIVHFLRTIGGHRTPRVQAPMELIMGDTVDPRNTPLVLFAATNAKNIISIIQWRALQLRQLVCVK